MPARFRFLGLVAEIMAAISTPVGRPPVVVRATVTGTLKTLAAGAGGMPAVVGRANEPSMVAKFGRGVAGDGGARRSDWRRRGGGS